MNTAAPTGGGTKVSVIKPGGSWARNRGDTPIDVLNQSGAATGVANAAYCIEMGQTSTASADVSGCTWKSNAAGTKAKLVCKNGTGNGARDALTPELSRASGRTVLVTSTRPLEPEELCPNCARTQPI